ncbi:MFS transporter [Halobiforma lacisalsi AJ5]|uniref:MFS transporter n=1 Tax=Natronobacterium lacisalsi AJ5 TaxID=358396 RepID=M0LNP9_NATLA|nr:MFS transporter [Halobiforma lacisalsi]APW97243.1 MFS transporter [Halobiforma lacisalsi AJ5]EMA34079.1 hypothetical protein C445_08677 [Halobiforma lacisalsi AJ5]
MVRSITWRFYAYRLSVSNGFYLPLSVLYLERVRGFGLDEIGLIMGAFSIAVVVAELPTGYVGDRLDRRTALAVGNVLSVAFMAGYVVVESPIGYLLLHVLWAFAWAFRSGTADAWLYELLAAVGDDDEFTRYRSRAMTIELTFEAATAAAAGTLAAFIGWNSPFLANAVLAALGVPILFTSPSVGDVRTDRMPSSDSLSVREAVRVLRVQARRPELRWFVAYVALFHGLYSVVRTFEQPVLEEVGISVSGLGLLYAGFKLVAAGAASTTEWISDRLGADGVLPLLAPVYGIAFLGVIGIPALVVPVLFLNRCVRVIVQPIRDQYLNDRLDDMGRATVLSGASMAISVTAGIAKIAAGEVSAAIGLLRFLTAAGIAIAAGGGLLWLSTSPVRPIGASTADDAAPAD